MNVSLTNCLDLRLYMPTHAYVYLCFLHVRINSVKCICFQNASTYCTLIRIFDNKDTKLVQ